jgi:hypothetical protein
VDEILEMSIDQIADELETMTGQRFLGTVPLRTWLSAEQAKALASESFNSEQAKATVGLMLAAARAAYAKGDKAARLDGTLNLGALSKAIAELDAARCEPNAESKLSIEVKASGVGFHLRVWRMPDNEYHEVYRSESGAVLIRPVGAGDGRAWFDASQDVAELVSALVLTFMPTEPWPKTPAWPDGSVPVSSLRGLSPGTRVGFARADGTIAEVTLGSRHTVDGVDLGAWTLMEWPGVVGDGPGSHETRVMPGAGKGSDPWPR